MVMHMLLPNTPPLRNSDTFGVDGIQSKCPYVCDPHFSSIHRKTALFPGCWTLRGHLRGPEFSPKLVTDRLTEHSRPGESTAYSEERRECRT